MKLKFEKSEDGEISVKIGDKDFVTSDYIEMIKEIKKEKKIEVEFGKKITKEERASVESMLEDINNIKEEEEKEEDDEEEDDDEIDLGNIPF